MVRHSRLLPASLAGTMLPAGELPMLYRSLPLLHCALPGCAPAAPLPLCAQCRRWQEPLMHPPTRAPGARVHIANAP